MNRAALLLIIGIVLCLCSYGQKQTQHIGQVWLAYFNQTRLSDRWGLMADFHLRTRNDLFSQFSTSIARAGLTFYATDKLRFTAGYAYVTHYHPDGRKVNQYEHRPWQQVAWQTEMPRSRISQSLRLEERFRKKITTADELGDGYNFNYRMRYNFSLFIPMSKNAFAANTLSFVFNDEVHVNMGKEIVNNYFDQNRLFAGFAYHINKSNYIQFGYMNLFQQLAAGNRYKNINAPRIYYYQQIDLRKK